jgi:chromosome segregation ATPase
MTHRIALVVVSLGLLGSVGGCTSTGIAVREKVFGIAKREQLVDRVEEARDSQGEAKEQFASALDEFLAITNQQGGDLEKRYKALQKEFDRSKSRAADVRTRIDKVEGVGNSLFKEWEVDNAKIGSATLRQQAEQQRTGSRATFDSMVRVMREAEGKMAPVLAAFQDQVLFLKSNLNAAAISGLQGEASRIQGDVQRLVAEMQSSIDEANRFIEQMNAGMGK